VIVVLGVPVLVGSPDGDRAGGPAGAIATAIAAAGGSVQLAGKLGDDPAGDRVLLALAAAGVGHAAVLRDPAMGTQHRSVSASATVTDVPGAGPGPGPDGANGRPPEDVDLAPAIGLLIEASDDGDGADGAVAPDGATDPTSTGSPDGPDGPEVPEPSEARPRFGGTARSTGIVLEAADIELALRYLVDPRVLIVATPLDAASALVVADAASFAGAQVIALETGQGVPSELGPATVVEVPASDPDGRFAELVGRFALALDSGVGAGDAFRDALGVGGWERIEP
jgi:hypothetical protein